MTRVLYVNQSGVMSGAEHSLLDLLACVPADTIAGLACPPGELSEAARALGVEAHALRGTDLSYRLDPVETFRGLGRMLMDAGGLRRLISATSADIVHANTTRAGLLAMLPARAASRPLVVHLRDWVPPGRLPQATMRTVLKASNAVIANSRAVRDQLPSERSVTAVHVVHNPVDTDRFAPDDGRRRAARQTLGYGSDHFVAAVVGQLTPWKGQDDAIRAVAPLRHRHPELRLLIAGSARFSTAGTRFDIEGYEKRLHEMVTAGSLEEVVTFAGQRDDVPDVMRVADVVLVPSWHEAFGRVALEALATGTPVIATTKGGPAEIVRDGVEGILLPPQRPNLWAKELERLMGDPADLERMGALGRARAIQSFSRARHADAVREVYRLAESGR